MNLAFDKKRRYQDEDGDDVINLSDSVVNVDGIPMSTPVSLSPGYEGRIDKFTYDNVGPIDDAIDTVMYANNITNPFAIDEGDVLFIPTHSNDLFKSSEPVVFPTTKNSGSNDSEESQFINNTNSVTSLLKSSTDENRKERLTRLARARKTNTKPVSPNMMQDGQTSKIFQQGQIILGTTIDTK